MTKYFRKVIRITAEQSPNVRMARAEIAVGRKPSGMVLVPGVLTWEEFQKRLATWDPIRQCVGLEAKFYQGKEILMYPPHWLDLAESRWSALKGRPRKPTAIGCDPGEGGANSSWSLVDDLGLVELVSMKTPDTTVIPDVTKSLMIAHNVQPERTCLDRGGGGKQHADTLRKWGYNVRTVAFGESLVPDPKRGLVRLEEKKEQREEHYAYYNRRAEMFWELRMLLDPTHEVGFALPPGTVDPIYAELRRQMSPIPVLYDPEGRIRMLPKNKRDPDSKENTLVDLIGHSPDELDSLVVAIHARDHVVRRVTAGAS